MLRCPRNPSYRTDDGHPWHDGNSTMKTQAELQKNPKVLDAAEMFLDESVSFKCTRSTNGLSDQWVVLPMGYRANGCRTNGL